MARIVSCGRPCAWVHTAVVYCVKVLRGFSASNAHGPSTPKIIRPRTAWNRKRLSIVSIHPNCSTWPRNTNRRWWISTAAVALHHRERQGSTMFHMIGHAIFGLIIGLIARAVMPGNHHMGWIMTMLLGIVGAWLGGLIGRMTGMYREGHPAGFFMALIGALITLAVYSQLAV